MKSLQVPDVTKNIRRFWDWFSEHATELAETSIPEVLLTELEEKLFAICQLDWELGPGRCAPNMLALSPRGDRELLVITKNIVAQAPQLAGWEFHPAKPPRDWNLVFDLIVGDKPVEIDGRLWEFIAYKFKDGTYELLFRPDASRRLAKEYLNYAATIIVDGELGEERRMELVATIEVVSSWEKNLGTRAKKLEPGLLVKLLIPPPNPTT